MSTFIQSALLQLLFFIVHQVKTQAISQDFHLTLYNSTVRQQSNISIYNIETELDTSLTQDIQSQIYIQVELILTNSSYQDSSALSKQNNDDKTAYCQKYDCDQNIFLAVLFSFNDQDFQFLYDNLDTSQSPPLTEYQDMMDYSAFLSQKKQHTWFVPVSYFYQNNRSQFSIGVINLQSKMYQQPASTFEYSLQISEIVKSQDNCSLQCLSIPKNCIVKKQVCSCQKNFFDLDCSLYAKAISNQILLTENYKQGSGGFMEISDDQIQLRQIIQKLPLIEKEQWIFQYLDIESDFLPPFGKVNSQISDYYQIQYDLVLTFKRSLFHNISLSYIFYGIDQVYTPNIFTNYQIIDNLPTLSQSTDKATLLQGIQLSDQAQIIIPFESLLKYKSDYENNQFLQQINVNPTLLFGFYNLGDKVTSNISYAVNIQFRQKQRSISSIKTSNNQNSTQSFNQNQTQLETSNIIIICVVSAVLLLGVLVFLFRKKICPQRYQKKQEKEKKSHSNVSVAGDSTPKKQFPSSQSNLQFSNNNNIRKSSQASQQNSVKRLLNTNTYIKTNQNQQQPIISYCKTAASSTNNQIISAFKNNKCSSTDQNEQDSAQKQQKQSDQSEASNKKYKQSNSLPVITSQNASCIIQIDKSNALLNGNNAPYSFQNGDKSFQSQNFIIKSQSRIEDLTDEHSNKQQTLVGFTTRRGFLDFSKSQLNITCCQQTMNCINQMTTQANSERKSFQTDWNLIQFNNQNTLLNIDNDYDMQNNKRRVSRIDNESQKQKKNSMQPLEIPVEEDEVQGASCDDSIYQNIKKNKNYQDLSQNAQDKNNSQIGQKTQQLLPKINIENSFLSAQSKQNNNSILKNTPNNLLFEKYILYGSSILKDYFKKSKSPETKIKVKQRINYKINKKFKKRKIKKQILTNDELDSDNVSILMHLNPNSSINQNRINKKITSRRNSINSSRYSANLRDSNSSRLSNKSIRKIQNTPKGVVSRFFQQQKKQNSSNNLRQKEKPFSVDLDISSMQKKIKLAESIFTGINHSSNNISLDAREIKSFPCTAEALDSPNNTEQKEQQTIKQNSQKAQQTENSFSKKPVSQTSPIIATQNCKRLKHNDEIVSEDRISQKSQSNNTSNFMINAYAPKISPKNGVSVVSNQILSFGMQKSNIGEIYRQGTEYDTPRLMAVDQHSKALLLPSNILNTSKRSEDLSTPGFIKTRNQNTNQSKPSTFFHQKYSVSPQRSQENNELFEKEEEKQFNLNSHSNIDSQVIKKCYHTEDRVISPFNIAANKQSFDLHSISMMEGENKMNELNQSINETTFFNNYSIDEGVNKNSIYKNSYNLKNKTEYKTPVKEDKITINSQDNEQIQINQVIYDTFNLKKLNSTKSYEYSLQHPISDNSVPINQQQQQQQQEQQNQDCQNTNIIFQSKSKYEYLNNQNQNQSNTNSINSNQISQNQTEQQNLDKKNNQQKTLPNPKAVFCQNGFLFTNLNQIKLNWENKVNTFTMSLSEVSNNNNNNINQNNSTFFQNGIESDIKNIKHAQSHQHLE
ncbi:hypothetical protein ABPG74_008374 [Tetrahymena malaccensis]